MNLSLSKNFRFAVYAVGLVLGGWALNAANAPRWSILPAVLVISFLLHLMLDYLEDPRATRD